MKGAHSPRKIAYRRRVIRILVELRLGKREMGCGALGVASLNTGDRSLCIAPTRLARAFTSGADSR
jgi:hypothetical protein